LDLSAAFDTIDHQVLISRFETVYGINGTALKWISSYLSNRYQSVVIGDKASTPALLEFGVPQGSVLGPKFYTMYTKPLGNLIRNHGLEYHMYADDTQIYLSFHPRDSNDQVAAIQRIETCLRDVSRWMEENKLKLNGDKSEVMIFSSRHYQDITDISVSIDGVSITSSETVKNLGVYLDRTLSMEKHVSSVSKNCYFHLRNIGHIRRLLNKDATRSLVQNLVTSRLDYCNVLLCSATDSTVKRLQLVQNTAARIITKTGRREHITSELMDLHWLPIKRRVEYKVLVHTFRALHGLSPSYIAEMIDHYKPARTLRSQNSTSLIVPRYESVTFGEKSFKVKAAKLWNSLPNDIRNVLVLDSFKNMLKTYLFKLEYGLL
jgi:hypothetical protein